MRSSIILSLLLVIAGAPGKSKAQSSVSQNLPVTSPANEISELEKNAKAGDPAAAFALGRAYASGKSLTRNSELAAAWYRAAADKGYAKAQNEIGVLYWIGEGVEKDKAEAVRWYHKATFQHDATAMFNIGTSYYNGEGVNASSTLAYAWFLLSAEAGNAAGLDAAKRSESEHAIFNDACVAIGSMYEAGQELPRDLQLAAAWYKKASSREGRQRLAGLSLQTGDYGQARESCEALAKEHQPAGAYCLGYLYQNGFGVPQDRKKAFKSYEEGANGGNSAALLALAMMYESGETTKVDRAQAMWLLIESGRHRNKEALVQARKLRAALNDNEWKRVQKKLHQNNLDAAKVDTFLHENSPAGVQ